MIIIPLMGACKERATTRLSFLLGAKSSPSYEELQTGKEMAPDLGESIAVFGSGEFGKDKWGKITIDWMDTQKPEFESGGVISWSPLKAKAIKVTGDVKVPLVAYLLEVTVDDQMNPKKMRLIHKWHLQPGKVEITN